MARWPTRKRLCKFVLAGLSVLLLAVLFVVREIQWIKAHRCSDQESRATLRKLCEEYAGNKVTGNLCPDLCTTHSIIYTECFNYKKERKTVMLAEWYTRKVILKSKYDRLQEYNSIMSRYTNDEGVIVTSQPDMAAFLIIVKNQLKTMFAVDIPYTEMETVQKMWQMPWENHETMSVATLDSLWALFQQDEYLMMQYFQGNKHFPKIYGSCGHFYVVEYTPPGDTLSLQSFYFKRGGEIKPSANWDKRAKVALSFLTLVEDLNTLHTEPLHLCDVKQDNYGVSTHLTIQAIDVDMAFFETKMRRILGQKSCTTNADCEFVHCASTCDLTRRRCSKHRSNNNLQAICKKIFVGHREHGPPYGGLLRSPPAAIADRLNKALQECVEPSDNDDQSQRATSETLETIRDLLQESLQSNEANR
ncbi:divergent protein kinase domain 1C-like [Branchiostoma lanceolatum]|uniref:divergent protein kinase domain 1C-like n=1 Tax=Branchiostoma lanceolatum TaxID=7740 RepID=UPI003451C329